MGTDIHPAIEYRQGDKWVADYVRPNKWFEEYGEGAPMTAEIDFRRCYAAFAILADVRNGGRFVPIAEPRGIPDNISPEGLAVLSNEHTPSWVTLDEILAFDWTREATKRGWVNAPEYEYVWRMSPWGPCAPKSWCGHVFGGGVRYITQKEMDGIMERFFKSGGKHAKAREALKQEHGSTYCQVSWTVRYADAAGDLWTKILPMMLLTRSRNDGAPVRLVFAFDN